MGHTHMQKIVQSSFSGFEAPLHLLQTTKLPPWFPHNVAVLTTYKQVHRHRKPSLHPALIFKETLFSYLSNDSFPSAESAGFPSYLPKNCDEGGVHKE